MSHLDDPFEEGETGNDRLRNFTQLKRTDVTKATTPGVGPLDRLIEYSNITATNNSVGHPFRVPTDTQPRPKLAETGGDYRFNPMTKT
jgi:hypothetical protein